MAFEPRIFWRIAFLALSLAVSISSAWHHPTSDFHSSSSSSSHRMYYKNPRNVPAEYCPRDEAAAELEGRTCLRKCIIDEDCKSKRKKCMCDGVCGLSCLNPERECGDAEEPEGPGGVKITGKSFGSKAIYSCPVGFHLIGVSERICQADGTWSNSAPSCNKSIFCAEAPKIANARHSSPEGQRAFALDTTLQYQCHPGYVSKGFPEAKCLLYHNGTAKWFGPDFTCQAVTCGYPVDILNGRREGFCDHYLCRVTYTCQPGFEIAGKSYRICQQNGSWSPEEPPVCAPIQCPQPKNPANGKAIFTSLAYNSLVTYECKYGFMLNGENTRRCGAHKQWTGPEPQCKEINCGSPGNGILHNGWIEGTRTTLHAVVIFHCNPGTKFDGSAERIVCQSDGTWSGPMPKCQVPCEIPEIQFGKVISTTNSTSAIKLSPRDIVPHGTPVGVVCDEHYEPVHNITPPTCYNGTWTHPPRCQPARCKSPPRPPRHGMVIAPKTEHSMKARYACRDGFLLVGNNITECQYGVWVGDAPTCQITYCKHLPPPDHGRVLLVGNMGYYDYRNYVTKVVNNRQIVFECDRGYMLSEGPVGKTCIRGEWAPKTAPPRCIPSKHPNYRNKRSARVKRKAIKSSSSNVLRGRGGASAGGGAGSRRIVRKKNKNGEEEEYEVAAAPMCPPDPLNNEYIMTELLVPGDVEGVEDNKNTSLYSHGATLKVSCVQGFGVNLPNETVRCINGKWKPKAPACNALPCKTPYIQHGSFYNGSKTLYFLEQVKHDTRLELKCSKGYKIKGRSTFLCHFGEWEIDDFPECVPVSCTLPYIDHGGAYYDGYLANSQVPHGAEVDYSCGKHKKLSPGAVTCHLGSFKPVKPMCLHPNTQLNYSVYSDHRSKKPGAVLFQSKRTCATPPRYNSSVAFLEGRPVMDNEYIFSNGTDLIYRCGPMKAKKKLRYKVICKDPTSNETGTRHPCTDDAEILEIEELRKSLKSNRTCRYFGDDEWAIDSKFNSLEDKTFSFYNGTEVIAQCGFIKPKAKTTKQRWKMTCEDGNWTGTPFPCEGELDYELIEQMVLSVNATCAYRGDYDAVATFYYDQQLQTNDTNFPTGTLLTSRCTDIGKYQMSGNTRRKCMSGLWLGLTPKCHGNSQVNDYALDKPPTILFRYVNGSIIQSNDGKLVVYTGTTLHMECLWIRKFGKPHWTLNNTFTENMVKQSSDEGLNLKRAYQEGWVTDANRDSTLEYRLTIENAQEEDSGLYTCNTPARHRNTIEIVVAATECRKLMDHPELAYSTDSTVLGTRVSFTCKNDYAVVGAQELVCMASGNWSAPLPRCVDVVCPDITLLPASIHLKSDGDLNDTAPPRISVYSRRVKGKALFSCQPGFAIKGSSEIVCQATGNWSGGIPLCERVHCPEPKEPNHGSLAIKKSSKSPLYLAGETTAQIDCDSGYALIGQPIILCLDNGTWSGLDQAKCARACQYINSPVGGKITPLKHYHMPDDTVTVTCSEGYELEGESKLTCLKSGKWSDPVPVCRVVDPFGEAGSSRF